MRLACLSYLSSLHLPQKPGIAGSGEGDNCLSLGSLRGNAELWLVATVDAHWPFDAFRKEPSLRDDVRCAACDLCDFLPGEPSVRSPPTNRGFAPIPTWILPLGLLTLACRARCLLSTCGRRPTRKMKYANGKLILKFRMVMVPEWEPIVWIFPAKRALN